VRVRVRARARARVRVCLALTPTLNLTPFQLLTGDAWAGFYLDAREVRFPPDKYQLSATWVSLYFVVFMCTMLMLTSVFVAIIVKNYSIQRSLSIDQETVANYSDVWLRYDAKVAGNPHTPKPTPTPTPKPVPKPNPNPNPHPNQGHRLYLGLQPGPAHQ
jgi:hypothetical protein